MPYKLKSDKRASRRAYYRRHVERMRAYGRAQSKAYHTKHRTKKNKRNRASAILRLYGLTMPEYKALFKAHRHRCAVCNAAKNRFYKGTKRRRRLAVDHCHKTGKIRGILCDRCNTVMGLLKDDVKLLLKMIKYLRSHNG